MGGMQLTESFVVQAQRAAQQVMEGLERLPPVPEVLVALQDLREAERRVRQDPASLTWSQRRLLEIAVERVEEFQQLTAPVPAPLKA